MGANGDPKFYINKCIMIDFHAHPGILPGRRCVGGRVCASVTHTHVMPVVWFSMDVKSMKICFFFVSAFSRIFWSRRLGGYTLFMMFVWMKFIFCCFITISRQLCLFLVWANFDRPGGVLGGQMCQYYCSIRWGWPWPFQIKVFLIRILPVVVQIAIFVGNFVKTLVQKSYGCQRREFCFWF